jgi:hypothetical protein
VPAHLTCIDIAGLTAVRSHCFTLLNDQLETHSHSLLVRVPPLALVSETLSCPTSELSMVSSKWCAPSTTPKSST